MNNYITGEIIEIIKVKDFYGPAVYAVRLKSNLIINVMINSVMPENVGNSIQITDRCTIVERECINPEGHTLILKPTFQELLKIENEKIKSAPKNKLMIKKLNFDNEKTK